MYCFAFTPYTLRPVGVASFESEKFASAENAIGEQNAIRRPDPYRKIGRSAASRFVVESVAPRGS
jgi:hypothetical protein